MRSKYYLKSVQAERFSNNIYFSSDKLRFYEIIPKKSKDGMVIFTLFTHTHILAASILIRFTQTNQKKLELYQIIFKLCHEQ